MKLFLIIIFEKFVFISKGMQYPDSCSLLALQHDKKFLPFPDLPLNSLTKSQPLSNQILLSKIMPLGMWTVLVLIDLNYSLSIAQRMD